MARFPAPKAQAVDSIQQLKVALWAADSIQQQQAAVWAADSIQQLKVAVWAADSTHQRLEDAEVELQLRGATA